MDLILLPGTYVWSKINKTYWPGIVITADDSPILVATHGTHLIFWFGDNRMSKVKESNIEAFAGNFHNHFSLNKNGTKWIKGVYDSIKYYGDPFTKDLSDEELLDFAFSDQFMKIDPKSKIGNIPEFVQNKVSAQKLLKWQEQETSKNYDNLTKINNDGHLIGKLCIACYSQGAIVQHPIFEGKICKKCAHQLKHTLYRLNNEGKYAFCVICGNIGKFTCEKFSCKRAYCFSCLKNLLLIPNRVGESLRFCILCESVDTQLIHVSNGLSSKLLSFYMQNIETKKIQKLPIVSGKILSMFHGVSLSFMHTLESPFNILVGNECCILKKQMGTCRGFTSLKSWFDNNYGYLLNIDLTNTTNIFKEKRQIHLESYDRFLCESLGNIVLLHGGLSLEKPHLHYYYKNNIFNMCAEFLRILQLYKSVYTDINWVYEVKSRLSYEDVDAINRFFNCKPFLLHDDGNANDRLIWTNLQTF